MKLPLRLLPFLLVVSACGSRTGFDVASTAGPNLPGHDAGVTAQCAAPQGLVTLFHGEVNTSHDVNGAIAVDDLNVYWIDPGDAATGKGSVHSVPKCGGADVTLATGLVYGTAIAADGTNVYFTDAGDSGHELNGSVSRVPRGGGVVTPLVSEWGPLDLAVDDASVYWVNAQKGTVSSIRKSGGPVTTLASRAYDVQSIAVGGANVYYTTSEGVMTVGKNGGSARTLVAASGLLWKIAVDASRVFWHEGDGNGQGFGALRSAALDGSGVATVVGSAALVGIALDGANIYYTDDGGGGGFSGAGKVMRVAKTGGQPATLASNESSGIAGMAVDGDSIYWINDRDVMRGAK